ncbi:MAG: hypothetical protein KGL39_44765, partial [Patescibacteria group bacterium]|nr:hypothetical protein [Patescibacteria group bacterium]
NDARQRRSRMGTTMYRSIESDAEDYTAARRMLILCGPKARLCDIYDQQFAKSGESTQRTAFWNMMMRFGEARTLGEVISRTRYAHVQREIERDAA